MKSYIPFLLLLLTCVLLVGSTLHSSSPTITVVMPRDGRPLSELTQPGTKVVGSERAILWWTIFKTLADKGYTDEAVRCANQAVDEVYGRTPVP